jgi:ribosomal protein S18 acetylase RimI-like enzyme
MRNTRGGTASTLLIRRADADDGEAIAELNRRLAAETESLALDPATIAAGVQAALADPAKARYFVATEPTGSIVGQVMHTYEWSDWRNGWIWWLQSVYVLPEYRGRGVLRRLVTHVIELGRSDPQVVGLRLYVEEHNTTAHAVYDRLGLAAAGYHVRELLWPR